MDSMIKEKMQKKKKWHPQGSLGISIMYSSNSNKMLLAGWGTSYLLSLSPSMPIESKKNKPNKIPQRFPEALNPSLIKTRALAIGTYTPHGQRVQSSEEINCQSPMTPIYFYDSLISTNSEELSSQSYSPIREKCWKKQKLNRNNLTIFPMIKFNQVWTKNVDKEKSFMRPCGS